MNLTKKENIKQNNIFNNIPSNLKEELFENIISKDDIKIEKIVSQGHTTAENEWYDQDKDEWVIVLQGGATISFEDEKDIHLEVGDYLNIKAHKKHRVSWTDENEKTIWLAIHY